MQYITTPSPIGDVTIAAQNGAICQIHLEGDRYFTSVPNTWRKAPKDILLLQAAREIQEYFAGTRKTFSFPTTMHGTPFQQMVWQALQKLPYGTTTTYATLAHTIGKPKAVRAVGTAVGRNPLCVAVPCHRVLASSGSLGGYVAGLERKQTLLTLEATQTL